MSAPEIALAAAYRAVTSALRRVNLPAYASIAPAGTARPYAVFFWTGGGERNGIRRRDANITMTVKCIADTQAGAFAGAAAIASALNDKGRFDDATNAINGGTTWDILTVTQLTDVVLVETAADGKQIYHAGAQYRLIMEER